MYIIKNALKCISRSKGRNILIGVIVFMIAISSCIGFSIRQAAESAKKETLASMSVTATISFDRTAMMSQMNDESEGKSFDKRSFAGQMGTSTSLSLEEYQTYAAAPSVEDFYYSMTVYVNGTDGFEPVNTDDTEEEDSMEQESVSPDRQNGMMEGKGKGVFGFNSDFTVVGYSGESAMTSFVNGTATINKGSVFATLVTEELATFNSISVGDSIQISNPNNEEECYTLQIVGIYSDSSANESSFSMFGSTSSDPANQIYMNYATLQEIISASELAVTELTDEDAESTVTALSGILAGTYVLSNVEDYELFQEEVRTLGLDDSYTVSSSDVSAYENSMVPLNTLSTMAGYFLIVILVIGAVILIVLNIFNIRERKYEIGVLTAMV